MQENIIALIYILLLSIVFFAFAGRSTTNIIEHIHYRERRNLWFGITIVAFLAGSFGVYVLITLPLLFYVYRRETNSVALFFFILFALPSGFMQISGLGLVSNLFQLTHARFLALFVLLPTYFYLNRQGDTLPFGRTGTDKVLALYLLLTAILYLRDMTLTDILRYIFYLFLDVFLPYFVISRSLKNLQIFKDALLSLVIAIMLLALLGTFESSRNWLLYRSVIESLGLEGGMTAPIVRDGMLRVTVTAGHPIALGYLMAVGIGFYLFLQGSFREAFVRRSGMALLIGGLLVPLSRGPWIGACLIFIVFIATGRNPARRLMLCALTGVLALLLISTLPVGEKVVSLLPYIGTKEQDNVEFREKLLTNSLIVIERNLWFGSVTFLEEPEMIALTENGMIDVTNTYIAMTLGRGVVGLGLFVGFFGLVILGVKRAMDTIANRDSEAYLLGRVLLSTLLGIMFIIYTTSSITIIPLVHWSVAGLSVAYVQMVRKMSDSAPL